MKATQLLIVWKIGRDSLVALPPEELRYGNTRTALHKEIKRLKAKFGKRLPLKPGIDTVPKLRRIASQYTEAQIRQWAIRVQAAGATFKPTHLIRLLGVVDRAKRDRLMERTIRHRWSIKRLAVEIQGSRGSRRSHVGRKPYIPNSRRACVNALHREIESWLRWTANASARLSGPIRAKLSAIEPEMLALLNAINPVALS